MPTPIGFYWIIVSVVASTRRFIFQSVSQVHACLVLNDRIMWVRGAFPLHLWLKALSLEKRQCQHIGSLHGSGAAVQKESSFPSPG